VSSVFPSLLYILLMVVHLRRNWSTAKKTLVMTVILTLTFSIYIGSAIYTASIPGLMEEFGISSTIATLGLSLFVWGYGIGPMVRRNV